MWPICPNCFNEQQEGMSNCDSGFPDYNGGSICNDCGACILNDQWIYEDDDEFERERKEDIERAGRMFQQDEIEDAEISAANWCACGLPRDVCQCDDEAAQS
jgi:hypothetical protein